MEARPRVLLVEDDRSLREAISASLVAQRFDVLDLDDADLAIAGDFRPHLAILDVGLPGPIDGFEFAARLRDAIGVPILFVTAADSLDDRLRGFEIGADDYLVKPFAMSELVARVRAVLRRTDCLPNAVHRVGDLVVDELARSAQRAGRPLDLTRTEFELLVELARHPGRVFSKTRLLSTVWGFAEYDPNLVEVHVSALRRKLETDGPRILHTERGAGYRLAPAFVDSADDPTGDGQRPSI